MSDIERAEDDPVGQLWDQLDNVRAGMLGIDHSDQHFQPMTHFIDREAECLWFITASDTDLVRAIGQGATAHYNAMGDNHDYHACLRGTIIQSSDTEKLDELWSVAAAAWFEEGREDPKVTLLQMTLRDGAIWASEGNAMIVGWKMIKAAMTSESHPAIGTQQIVSFNKAA
ncbi:pyridoxamine 5'-phosphate oxidase family protein [Pseudaestuariivita rosea]|uniref:pyridoxamine 5'-phosphate oxidase family protein n=1 Tax=Pseudaestuariivita rosea TaxID=2763263 RepID=UPI001ABADC54|nr:pyridoxamine 5'-phosphate oxidase family protein [Pseudaestuariivita rosea]